MSEGAIREGGTVIDELIEALRQIAVFNGSNEAPPAVVLWLSPATGAGGHRGEETSLSTMYRWTKRVLWGTYGEKSSAIAWFVLCVDEACGGTVPMANAGLHAWGERPRHLVAGKGGSRYEEEGHALCWPFCRTSPPTRSSPIRPR
jgi:hypothetical protein